jgi:hypothetical protein
MKRVLIAGLLSLGLLLPATAASQPASAPAQPQSQALVHDGVLGMWFPMDASRRLLADIETLSSYRTQVDLLEQKLELRAETIALVRDNEQLTQQQANHWRTALQASLAKREHKPSVWESPTFWFFTGFVASAALAIGMLYGLDQAGGS